jgi:hypothetical protein
MTTTEISQMQNAAILLCKALGKILLQVIMTIARTSYHLPNDTFKSSARSPRANITNLHIMELRLDMNQKGLKNKMLGD